MLVLAYGYAHVAVTPATLAARRGVLAVVVALLLGTMFRLTIQSVKTPMARMLAVGGFAVVALLPHASPWVVLAAGFVGLLVYRDAR